MDPLFDRRAVLTAAAGAAAAPPAKTAPIADSPAPRTAVVVGAIADGQHHALAERFSSLAQARAVFPSAHDLSESVDGAAIQSAIDLAERRGLERQLGARLFLPAGRYVLTRSLILPNNFAFEGEGPHATIVDNQNSPLAAPLIVNRDPTVKNWWLKGFSLHGGSHGLRITVTGSVDGLHVEDVSCELQTDKNFECDRLLQMATFRDCRFGAAPFGFYASGWTSNVVAFERCSFENHTCTHLHLRGAECVAITGGRFEGGVGTDIGQATLDCEDAAAIAFTGVYFENTHRLLLRERRSRNGISFDKCHFTGTTGMRGREPYSFDSDGIVTFGANDWGMRMIAPARTALNGINPGLAVTGRLYHCRTASHHHIVSEPVRIARAVKRAVLVLSREGSGDGSDTMLAGALILEIRRIGRDGSPMIATHRYQVAANAPGQRIAARIAAPPDTDAPVMRVRSGDATATVSIEIEPAEGDRLTEIRWTFQGSTSGERPDVRVSVDLS